MNMYQRTKNYKKIKNTFFEKLNTNDIMIIASLPNLTKNKTINLYESFRKEGVKINMNLKRLVYKLFIKERKINEKTGIEGNLYVIKSEENSFQNVNKTLELYNGKILYVIKDKKVLNNYRTYVLCNFDHKLLVQLIIKCIVMPIPRLLSISLNKK